MVTAQGQCGRGLLPVAPGCAAALKAAPRLILTHGGGLIEAAAPPSTTQHIERQQRLQLRRSRHGGAVPKKKITQPIRAQIFLLLTIFLQNHNF